MVEQFSTLDYGNSITYTVIRSNTFTEYLFVSRSNISKKWRLSMEIERKYLLRQLPEHLENYSFHLIEQAYLCTSPVVRVRRQDNTYYLTYKGGGLLMREEYNLPLDQKSYEHLKAKADGQIITKKRYLIPIGTSYTAELDIFSGEYSGLILAEVEFPTKETADQFVPPNWFGKEVTFDPRYHNSYMSTHSRSSLDL